MVKRDPIQIKRTGSWKPGYRFLNERVQDHPGGRSIRFRYYSWLLWLPAQSILQMSDGSYIVPYNVVDSAKAHESAHKCDDVKSALFEAGLT